MRRPSNSLDCCQMLRELYLRSGTVVDTPNQQLIIITSRSQLLLIKAPLKSTYLLLMSDQLRLIIVLCSQISMQYAPIFWPCAEKPAVPRDTAHSSLVTTQTFDYFALGCVPDLKVSGVGAHSQMCSCVRPLNTRHWIICAKVIKFRHLVGVCWPEIHTGAETHCQNVRLRPVHKVQIKVILEGRGVQDFERNFRNISLLLVGSGQ